MPRFIRTTVIIIIIIIIIVIITIAWHSLPTQTDGDALVDSST